MLPQAESEVVFFTNMKHSRGKISVFCASGESKVGSKSIIKKNNKFGSASLLY